MDGGLSSLVHLLAEYAWYCADNGSQLSKLDSIQCLLSSYALQSLCFFKGVISKLLDGSWWEHLQMFCPSFLSSISLPWRSQHLNISWPFCWQVSLQLATSLDLFYRSFLPCTTMIWNTTQLDNICSNICQSY